MSAIQASGLAGDPTEVANKILASSMSGDPSGFDDILRAAEDGESRARAVTPPPPCAEYHARTLILLHDGITLTRSLRSALERQDTSALASLATSASSLQNRTEALQQEERNLKVRYGVAP